MIMNRTEFNIVTIFFVLSVFYTESLLSDQAYIEDYVDGDSLDLEHFSEEIFDFEELDEDKEKAFVFTLSHQFLGQINSHNIDIGEGEQFRKNRTLENNRTKISLKVRDELAKNLYFQASWQGETYFKGDQIHEDSSNTATTRINEFFVQRSFKNSSLKLGRQSITWGKTLGNSVLDIINPIEFVDFSIIDIEDIRLNQSMMRFDMYSLDSSLSFFLTLDPQFDPLPPIGSIFYSTSLELFKKHQVDETLYEIGLNLSKDYQNSSFSLIAARLIDNQRRYDFSADFSPVHRYFNLYGFAGEQSYRDFLFTIDIAYSQNKFENNMGLQGLISNPLMIDAKSDYLGTSLGLEYGSATNNYSVSISVEKEISSSIDTNTERDKSFGTWLMRYSKTFLSETLNGSISMQGDIDNQYLISSATGEYKITDDISLTTQIIIINGRLSSPLSFFDNDIRISSSVSWTF